MKTWWLVLMSRSSRDSATTGLGNSGYQSAGLRFDVRISERPARSVISSYRSSAWAAVSSRMPKSSSYSDVGVTGLIPIRGLSRLLMWPCGAGRGGGRDGGGRGADRIGIIPLAAVAVAVSLALPEHGAPAREA